MASAFLPEILKPLPLLKRPSTPWEQGAPWRHAPHVHPSCSLTLEWNNLGTWEDAFATFCRALASNGSLQQLDLRNNQISHKGAEELALALKSNASLQQLGEAACAGPLSQVLHPIAPSALLLLLSSSPESGIEGV